MKFSGICFHTAVMTIAVAVAQFEVLAKGLNEFGHRAGALVKK